MNTIDTDYLPPLARELVDVVGLDATRRLIERWGGTRLYVPAKISDDHPIAAAIGRVAADALSVRYNATELNLPRAAQAMREALYRSIVAAYTDGATAAELAREHQCTERWIYALVARHRAERASRQASLL